MTVGERIKRLREENKMTQEELAKNIKSTKQTIYKYENNIITNIPSDKIEGMAKILNTSPSYLMGWEDDRLRIMGFDEKDIEILKNRYGSSLSEHLHSLKIDNQTLYFLDKSDYDDLRSDLIQTHYNSMNPTGQDSLVSIMYFLTILNSDGQNEAVKRIEELSQIEKYTMEINKPHLLPNAAHEIEGASDEDKAHDDAMMNDDNF